MTDERADGSFDEFVVVEFEPVLALAQALFGNRDDALDVAPAIAPPSIADDWDPLRRELRDR